MKSIEKAIQNNNNKNNNNNTTILYTHRLKALKSKSDSLLGDNSTYNSQVGSSIAMNKSLYQDNLRRFNATKELANELSHYERNKLGNYMNCISTYLRRRGNNLIVKGVLGFMVISSMRRWRIESDRKLLKGSEKCACPVRVVISSVLLLGSVVLL